MRALSAVIAVLMTLAQVNAWADCDMEKDVNQGPHGPATFFNITYDKTVIYGLIPHGIGPFPLLGFMHGTTAEWAMYNENLELFASHGFVVVFPHIKNPSADTHWWETNTNGEYLIKAINWAIDQNSVEGSDLYHKVDTDNVVYAGHSMGATCAIKGSHEQLDQDNIKLTVSQHPGLCGPFGPPPSPITWSTNQLEDVVNKHPVLLTTAKNDGAFLPAPQTAASEYGCWSKSMNDQSVSAFIEFSADVCQEDGARDPFPDGGHNCPMRFADGGKPENPWVLVALKLYAQHDGAKSSKCYSLLWGYDTDSLNNSQWTERIDLREGPDAKAIEIEQ